MKRFLPVLLTIGFLLLAPAVRAQGGKARPPAATPAPGAKTTIGVDPQLPAGARRAEITDLQLSGEKEVDPYQLEKFGVAAVQKKELVLARKFFEDSWRVGELPSAQFNLACVDVREGKTDAAFRALERAIAAGFDDEKALLDDTDLAPVRGDARFGAILSGLKKNVAAGDAAVVHEATFVAPAGKPRAILILLHGVSSDPLSAAGPFVSEARARGLFLAVPRGPAKAGKKRFGWGAPSRAATAVAAIVDAARRKAGNPNLPILFAGLGKGGKIALELSAIKGGVAGVGSIGGAFDPGEGPAERVAGLRGARLFLGVARDADPNLVFAMKQGRDNMKKLGLTPVWAEWAGTGDGFPSDASAAVRDLLNALAPLPAPKGK